MQSEVLVALIAFFGTLIGTFGGIITSGKLTVYRISQLEKKVDEQGEYIKKLPLIEKEQQIAEERLRILESRTGMADFSLHPPA